MSKQTTNIDPRQRHSELPRIRQVTFTLDKNANYKFDVNSTTTIKGLKRMITVAANLSKHGLRIFSGGKEYTEEEEESLNSLFPEKQQVEFSIKVDVAASLLELNESKIKLRLGANCPEHDHKFLYFYCYDCNKSICSLCNQGVHKQHSVIEKYDYLQSSKHLVDVIFQDFGKFMFNIKLDRKSEAEQLKKKLKEVLFPELVDLLKAIEKTQIEMIDKFIQASEGTYNNLKENVGLLKEHCVTGLDKLKDELHIENLLTDEEVFLVFDSKYRQIACEQLRLKDDQKKYEALHDQFDFCNDIITKVHNHLYGLLNVEVENQIYSDILGSIQHLTVDRVKKEEVIEKLLSNVSKVKSGKKSVAAGSRSLVNESGILSANEQKSQNLDTSSANKINFNNVAAIFNAGKDNKENFNEPIPVSNPQTSLSVGKSNNNLNQTPENPLKNKDNIPISKDKSGRDLTKSFQNEPLCLDKIVMRPYSGSTQVLIYNDNEDGVEKRKVEFTTFGITINEFLPNCAWSNALGTGKLYISGGQTGSESGSKAFLCYDYIENKLTKFPDMNVGRFSHSMIYHNNAIYVVGGHKNNTCEKFDLQTMSWLKLSNINFEEKQNSILIVHNNQLYSFFGYMSKNYLDSVERLKLSNPKSKWEIFPLKNPEKINLKLVGCGVVHDLDNPNKIHFLGGKSKNDSKGASFAVDFNDSSVTSTDNSFDGPTYFHENILHRLGEDSFGQFDEENGEHFLKISLS